MDERVVAYRFGDYPSGSQQILEALKLANVVNEQVQRVRDACADSECRAPFGKVFSAFYTLSGGVKENERNASPGFLDDRFDLSSIPLSGLAVSKCVDVLAKHGALIVCEHKVNTWVSVFHLLPVAQERRFSFSLCERGHIALQLTLSRIVQLRQVVIKDRVVIWRRPATLHRMALPKHTNTSSCIP